MGNTKMRDGLGLTWLGVVWILRAAVVCLGDCAEAAEPIAHWEMEEVQAGVLEDAARNGHDGVHFGEEKPAVVDGIVGKALAFDGQAAGGLTVAKSEDFHLPQGLSVMAWIKPGERGAAYEILCMKGDQSGDPPWPGWRFRYFWSRVSFEFGTTDGRQVRVSSAEWSTPAGFWSHVAAVYDGQRVRLYVNASLVVEQGVEGELARQKRPVIVANYVGRKNAYAFHGALDEVKVFDGCLSEDEVFAEACRGMP